MPGFYTHATSVIKLHLFSRFSPAQFPFIGKERNVYFIKCAVFSLLSSIEQNKETKFVSNIHAKFKGNTDLLNMHRRA